jgi:hypothetical protein
VGRDEGRIAVRRQESAVGLGLTKKSRSIAVFLVRLRFSKRHPPLLFVAGLAVILSFAGCEKKSGEAVILGKEFVPALKIAEAPKEQTAVTQKERFPSLGKTTGEDDKAITQDQEIPNPRAAQHDQWIVDVQMISDRRQIGVRVEPPQFQKLKVGDRVKVTYRQGKYTGTVWDAEID